MKKTIFLGIAALLALAMFSCGDPRLAEEDEGITLGVNGIAGRALIGTTAEAGTNFYEAAFLKTGNPVVRATWNFARNGRIKIEPGTYTVILMAGRNSDKTLLGVGAATNIAGKGTGAENGSVTPNTLAVVITTSTTDLYFTVFPLINDIKSTTGSTFATTTPTQVYPTPTTKDELNNIIPIFMIDQGTASIATWTYGIRELTGTGALGATPALGNLITTFGPSIVIARAANGTPQFFVTGFSVPEELDIPQLLNSAPIFTPTGGATTGSPLTGTFGMSFTAKANGDGIVQVAFQVPVVAFSDAVTDNPVIWYIRGGLNNGALDAGIGTDGEGAGLPAKSGMLGGAIVLGFGNLSAFPDVNLHR